MSNKHKPVDFQPSLQQILEESSRLSFDESIDFTLLEYAVLTDDDLKKALYLDSSEDETEEVEDEVDSVVDEIKINVDQKDGVNLFESIHNSTNVKNQELIQKFSPALENNDNDTPLEDTVFLNDETKELDEGINDSTVSQIESIDKENTISPFLLQPDSTSKTGDNLSTNTISSIHEIFDQQKIIDLKSQQGKKMFAQAIQKKCMNIYYLISQNVNTHNTQNSFNQCLNVVLDSLELQKRDLKYLEEVTNPYVEFSLALQKYEIPFESYMLSKSFSVDKFRSCIKLSCASSNIIMVLCYYDSINRFPHFSLIGGYYKDKDMVLVVDVVRMKHPIKWIALKDMFLHLLNTENNEVHGYYMINTDKHSCISISNEMLLHFGDEKILSSFNQLRRDFLHWLPLTPFYDTKDEILLDGFNQWISSMKKIQVTAVANQSQQTKQKLIYNHCSKELLETCEKMEVYHQIATHIVGLNIEDRDMLNSFIFFLCHQGFIEIRDIIPTKKLSRKLTKKKKKSNIGVDVESKCLAAIVTCLFIFWPYSKKATGEPSTNQSVMDEFVQSEASSLNDFIKLGQNKLYHILRTLEYSANNIIEVKSNGNT